MTLESSREGYTGRQKRKASRIEEGFEKGVLSGNERRTLVKISKSPGTGKMRTGLSGGPIWKQASTRPVARRSRPPVARPRAPAGVA